MKYDTCQKKIFEDLNIGTDHGQLCIFALHETGIRNMIFSRIRHLIIIDCKSVAKIRRKFLLRAVHNVERRI